MTCKLRADLETAASALKEAVKRGLDVEELTPCDMGEIYNAYNSVKRTLNNLPEHKEDQITFSTDVQFPDGTYDPDYNISIPLPGVDHNFNVNSLAYDGSQPLDFNVTTGSTDTVTVPEHEDDEKIVL